MMTTTIFGLLLACCLAAVEAAVCPANAVQICTNDVELTCGSPAVNIACAPGAVTPYDVASGNPYCYCPNGYESGFTCYVNPTHLYSFVAGTAVVCNPGQIDPACANVDCGPNGSCLDGYCRCDGCHSGPQCATLNPCGGHGNCSAGSCSCTNGYSGPDCTVSPSACYGLVCPTGQTCQAGTCATSPPPSGEDDHRTIYIMVGALGGFVALVLLAAACFCCRRKRQQQQQQHQQENTDAALPPAPYVLNICSQN